jgi:ABC-type antimicrobial peptide transport system permease subunit
MARLRALANEVDPSLVIASALVMKDVVPEDWYLVAMIALGGTVLVAILVALASSGIYAILSYTVAQRTREIGIRTALGAGSGSIAFTIARRALAQVGVGILLGMPVAGWLFFQLNGDPNATLLAFLAGILPGLGVLLVIGLCACTAPTLRALRIMPTEALRG